MDHMLLPIEYSHLFLFVKVFEGYGQTECTAGATLSLPGDFSVGHVGAPLPCNFIKLVDVPEMDYYAKNNEGEVRYYKEHCRYE